MRRALSPAVLITYAALLAGCSLGGDDDPEPARGAPREIAAVVAQLDRATRQRDWAMVCDELFTAGARSRAGGEDCARLLGSTGRDVRRPRIQIAGIVVKGNRATVRVRSTAVDQPPLTDELLLERERGGYRIAALR